MYINDGISSGLLFVIIHNRDEYEVPILVQIDTEGEWKHHREKKRNFLHSNKQNGEYGSNSVIIELVI